MKRFNIDAPANSQYEEAPDGEWVLYEDANAWWNEVKQLPRFQDVAEIHDLKARLATATEQIALLERERDEARAEWKRISAFLANRPAAPRCAAHQVGLANLAFYKCGCRHLGQPAAPRAWTELFLHPDLFGFDLRRPFEEWPETVRKLIDEREAKK